MIKNRYNIEGGCYYHNDMVNMLRSQYMLMTFEPVFYRLPFVMTSKHANNNLVIGDGDSGDGGDDGKKGSDKTPGETHYAGITKNGTWAIMPEEQWDQHHSNKGQSAMGQVDAYLHDDAAMSDWTVVPLAPLTQSSSGNVDTTTTANMQQPAPVTTTTTTLSSSPPAEPATPATGIAVLKKGTGIKRMGAVSGGGASGAKKTAGITVQQGVSIHEDGSVDMHRIDAL